MDPHPPRQGSPAPTVARLFAIGGAVMLAALLLMVAIPHDRAVRWRAVRTEAFARIGWAYTRIHDDPTPIDIALIGTSHTMNGIDGLAVARRIAADGARDADGRCLTVTNFAVPSYGRNLHWLIARELLSARRPKAIVLEVFENETRKPHPLFYSVAETRDLLGAPVLLNLNYVADLIRLPYRQFQLGVESLAPAEFGLPTRFDRRDYDGSTVDNTRVVNVHGEAMTPPLTGAMEPAKLAAEGRVLRAQKRLHMLPLGFDDYEYAIPNHYVRALLAEADRAGTPVYLLYLPGYRQPPRPYDERLYRGRTMLTVNDALRPTDVWRDVHHLNAKGAAIVSRELGDLLARTPIARTRDGRGGCDFGYPARPSLQPFVRRPGGASSAE